MIPKFIVIVGKVIIRKDVNENTLVIWISELFLPNLDGSSLTVAKPCKTPTEIDICGFCLKEIG